MHDGTAETHLLSGLRSGVQGVVVAIEAVEESGLVGGLIDEDGVRLLALGRGVIGGRGALGAVPAALADEEGAGGDAGVDVAVADIDEVGLDIDDTARLALVVDAQDLGADFELLALGGGGEGLEEFNLALAVEDSRGVELGDVGDLDGLLGGVEVDHIGLGALEGWGLSC